MNKSRMKENQGRREDVFSKVIRAGKRTYFFDVKATKAGENFITITESKKRFSSDQGKFYFEKHKVFLYKEDFDKFEEGFNEVLEFVKNNQGVVETDNEVEVETEGKSLTVDVSFEDLGKEDSPEV